MTTTTVKRQHIVKGFLARRKVRKREILKNRRESLLRKFKENSKQQNQTLKETFLAKGRTEKDWQAARKALKSS